MPATTPMRTTRRARGPAGHRRLSSAREPVDDAGPARPAVARRGVRGLRCSTTPSSSRGRRAFWARQHRLQRASVARDARRPALGEAVGERGDADRPVIAFYAYIRNTAFPAAFVEPVRRHLPLPPEQMVFRRALRLPVRPPVVLARPPALEERRRRHDRPLRPRRRRRGGRRRHPRSPRGPDRLSLHLRAGHAARPRRRDDLGDGAVSDERLSHPVRSCSLVPMLRRARLPARAPTARAGSRWSRRWSPRARHPALGDLRLGGAQWQFPNIAPVFGRFAWALGIDGIALMLIMLSVFLMPICIVASGKRSRSACPNIWPLPAHGNADDRRLRGAGPVPVLHLLRSRPDPDVPDHRHLGRRNRIYAAYKFFLYTLLGSVLMLIAMLWMVNDAGTTDIPS